VFGNIWKIVLGNMWKILLGNMWKIVLGNSGKLCWEICGKLVSEGKDKGKFKFHPINFHEGTEGQYRHSSNFPLSRH
jgi:hypothetical protein